jgi:hypothetical protein
MGIDRFVYWREKPGPSMEDIKTVLEDYLGGAAVEVSINQQHITAILVGRPNFPFRRVPDHESMAATSEQHEQRWLEVYVGPKRDHIDIITRMTDEFTNVVAEGFAQLAARFWKGKHGQR